MKLDKLDQKTMQIIEFLLENPVMDYSKTEIAELSGISRSTLYRRWDTLEELGILEKTRKYQNTQLYSLNTDSEIVNLLGRLQEDLVNVEQESQEKIAAVA